MITRSQVNRVLDEILNGYKCGMSMEEKHEAINFIWNNKPEIEQKLMTRVKLQSKRRKR